MSFSTEINRSTIYLTDARKQMLKDLCKSHSTDDEPKTQNQILNAALSAFIEMPIAKREKWLKKGWRT